MRCSPMTATGASRPPAKTGRVFVMREWLETKAQYICTELGITSNHCGAMLYRARMQFLRGALRRIGKEEPPCAE
jgi:RNA polymerase sigma-70 factor, ECF subfamily